MTSTRRDLLQYALYGGSAAALPGCLSEGDSPTKLSQASHSPDDSRRGVSVPEFAVPLPIAPLLAPSESDATTDYYEITMAETVQQVLPSGGATTLWTYNGTWPGPTIKARRGRRAVVRQINALPVVTTIHLHGAMVAAASDGHPTDYIHPGSYKDYDYPNIQEAAILWYHDHTMDLTGPQVYKGLAGFYLIGDDHEDSLNLPSGSCDVPLVIQDRTFASNNQLIYNLNNLEDEGFLGDTYCVNGAPVPYFEVGRRKYRFRLLNGSNSRVYQLRLSNGANIIQIGSDGGLLVGPLARQSIAISPGERVDVVIDFSQVAVGSSVRLVDGGSWSSRNVMRFDVTHNAVDTSTIPSTLNTIDRIPANQSVVTRRISLDDGRGDAHWLINNRAYDPARIDFRPRLNTIERWDVVNNTRELHPFHQHLVQFQVLSYNGSSPPAHLRGWKDTLALDKRDSASIIMKFEGFAGVYVFHCHRLEHEDHRMMAQQEVVT
jgi:spore coat protein A, manganese oxidase